MSDRNPPMKKELALILLISGCTSTPITFEMAKEAPPERVFNAQEKNASRLGKIVVVRNDAFQLAGCPFLISVNNKPLASIQNAEKFSFYVDDSEQSLSIGMDLNYSSFCNAFGIKIFDTLETRVKPNEVKYWRIERERLIRDFPKPKA